MGGAESAGAFSLAEITDFVTCVCLAISACYEFIEWGTAVLTGISRGRTIEKLARLARKNPLNER